jgi:hypothetical protein
VMRPLQMAPMTVQRNAPLNHFAEDRQLAEMRKSDKAPSILLVLLLPRHPEPRHRTARNKSLTTLVPSAKAS